MNNEAHLRFYCTGVREVCELVVELFTTERSALLSNVIRETVLRRVKGVLEEHNLITAYLEVPRDVDLEEVRRLREKP